MYSFYFQMFHESRFARFNVSSTLQALVHRSPFDAMIAHMHQLCMFLECLSRLHDHRTDRALIGHLAMQAKRMRLQLVLLSRCITNY